MKIYRCPKNCHVSNKADRCPKCGQWLVYDGDFDKEKNNFEHIQQKTEDIQRGNMKNNQFTQYM
jgi:hypothetical protein